MNSADDDDSTAILIVLPIEDGHYEEVADLDLLEFDIYDARCHQKKGHVAFKN